MLQAISIAHMKLPSFLWRDGELDVTAHAEQRLPKMLGYLYEEDTACQCEEPVANLSQQVLFLTYWGF